MEKLVAEHRIENFQIQNSDVAQRLSALEELKTSTDLLLQTSSVWVF